MRMNPSEFDQIMAIMGLSPYKKVELMAYQLKRVANALYDQWVEARSEEAIPIAWENFMGAFLDQFFPLKLRKAEFQEFIKLYQGNMSIREYPHKFTKLLKYAPCMITDPRKQIRKFISGVLNLVSKECKTIMLMNKIDIS